MGAITVEANAYDGHTLKPQLLKVPYLNGKRIRNQFFKLDTELKGIISQ
jgi:hypothetical protein